MTDEAAQLIDAFTALPSDQRHVVFLELARITERDAGPLTDDELVAAGDQLFSMYDQEEADRGTAETG